MKKYSELVLAVLLICFIPAWIVWVTVSWRPVLGSADQDPICAVTLIDEEGNDVRVVKVHKSQIFVYKGFIQVDGLRWYGAWSIDYSY